MSEKLYLPKEVVNILGILEICFVNGAKNSILLQSGQALIMEKVIEGLQKRI